MFEKQLIAVRLREAAAAARAIARKCVREHLPDDSRFHLNFNSSYDGFCLPGTRLYPEDSSEERARRSRHLEFDATLDELWRDGHVPEWADLSVTGVRDGRTLITIDCCGRFTANATELYHQREGYPPFHALGAWLPGAYGTPGPHSIHSGQECWTRDDLRHALAEARLVRSLKLVGGSFDDAVLAECGALAGLHWLELRRVRTTGAGLGVIGMMPRLEQLRIRCRREIPELDLSSLPPGKRLRSLALEKLPPELRGVGRLSGLAAGESEYDSLTLASSGLVTADEAVDLAGWPSLHLRLPVVPSWLRSAEGTRSLYVTCPGAAEGDVLRLIDSCLPQLKNLDLSGTPVSEAVVDHVLAAPGLAHLNVVDTRVTHAALVRFRRARPEVRCNPSEGWWEARA